MNEHARSIYQAAMDGKTVQRCLANEWQDENPFKCLPAGAPATFPEIWRVKPKTETRYYRVYFNTRLQEPEVVLSRTGVFDTPDSNRDPWFGGWLSSNETYAVEVPE